MLQKYWMVMYNYFLHKVLSVVMGALLCICYMVSFY